MGAGGSHPQAEIMQHSSFASPLLTGKGFFNLVGGFRGGRPRSITRAQEATSLIDTIDSGCNGKLIDIAFAFAEENATCTEDSYSYAATKGTRRVLHCTLIAQGSVKRYKNVPTDSEQRF